MAEPPVVVVDSPADRPPLRLQMLWAYRRIRGKVLPRKWTIRWEMAESSRAYRKERADARARGAAWEEIEGIRSSEAVEYWTLEEELEQIETRKLLKEKDRLLMADLPGFAIENSEYWQQGNHFKPIWYLTRAGMEEMRRRIRKERKERREPVLDWLKVIASFGGGGVLGFFAKEFWAKL